MHTAILDLNTSVHDYTEYQKKKLVIPPATELIFDEISESSRAHKLIKNLVQCITKALKIIIPDAKLKKKRDNDFRASYS